MSAGRDGRDSREAGDRGPAEVWGVHPRFPKYEISTQGRARNAKTKKILSARLMNAYLYFGLYDNKKKQHDVSVAWAVLETHVGPPPSREHTADHIDPERPHDNSVGNLRWATRRDQILNRREPCRQQMTSIAIVRTDSEGRRTEFPSVLAAADASGVHRGHVSECCRGKRKSTGGFRFAYASAEDPDLPGEEWREPPEIEGSGIAVSRHGRVRDSRRGVVRKRFAREYLTERRAASGMYPVIEVDAVPRPVHRLVWSAFGHRAPAEDEVVRHIDHDKSNAAFANLELATRTDTALAAQAAGRSSGKTARKRVRDAATGEEFESLTAGAKARGVCVATAHNYLKRGTWVEVCPAAV